MGFAGFLAICVGIMLCVLSANGRLQNVIAAFLGQQSPGATPTGGGSNGSGGTLFPGGGGGTTNNQGTGGGGGGLFGPPSGPTTSNIV